MSNVTRIHDARPTAQSKSPAVPNPLTADDCDRAFCLINSAAKRLDHARELVLDVEDDFEAWSRIETTLELIHKDLETAIEQLEPREPSRTCQLCGELVVALESVRLAETAAGQPCIFVGHECGLSNLLGCAAKTLIQARLTAIALSAAVRCPKPAG